MTYRKVGFAVLAALLVIVGMTVLGACGNATDPAGDSRDATAASPMPEATGEPLIFGFDAGFTGFMAMDVELAEKGILTKLDMIQNQWEGRPVEYKKADNGSDPVQAVDKARQLVESDGIQYMAGPIFSPSAAAVTDYLAKAGGIPQCSIVGQPSDNLKTANDLAFMPNGLYGSQGYYFGKYVGEQLGYKTVNCINLEDTAARQLQAGFEKGLAESGGQVVSVQYVPIDTIDFSSYLTTLKDADATYFWVFGNGAAPFVKQYNDYGLTAPLIAPMSNNFSEQQLADLGQLGVGMVACDFYSPEIDNEANAEFVAAYQKLYPGEYPAPQAYGGYQAVDLFLQGVSAAGGDTTPEALVKAMSTITLTGTPAGDFTMKPYQGAYIPVRDWYILETKEVGGRVAWVPIYTFEQVELGE
jgi:branched-chain amino acid transport system substrate-binding protein